MPFSLHGKKKKNVILSNKDHEQSFRLKKGTHAQAKQENGRGLYPVGKTDFSPVIFTV